MDSTITVAIISGIFGIITVLINKNTNKKINKIEDIKRYCKEMMDNHILENDKTYLTDFLSDVEVGEPKSEIQIRRAYEIKKEYNEKGGDSYIDDKWTEVIKKGLLKLKERKVN